MTINQVAQCGDRILEALADKDMKAVDLSKLTGISESVLSRYISNDRVPRSDAIFKMAVALGVREMWLWGCDCPKEREQSPDANDRITFIVSQLKRRPGLLDTVEGMIRLPEQQLTVVRALIETLNK